MQTMEAIIEERLIADYQKLYRLAYSYVQNESDALDIVQESAYRAIKSAHTLKQPQFVGTWLYRIVVNQSITHLRKHNVTMLELEEGSSEVEDHYADPDLQEALKQLDVQDRTVVVLRYFEGLQLHEIAQVLKEKDSTVKSRLYRALKKLKLSLTEEGAE